MTISTFTWMSAQTGATATEWRKWIQGIHDALAAIGLVQTADTGQLTISTASVPGINTWTNYEVWRFNDALQSTHPIFFRIDYGTGNSAGRADFRLTVGTASDGAGTITGNTLLAATVASPTPATASSTEYPSYASGDGSSFSIALWPATGNLAGHLGGFTIARACNTDGTYRGDALVIAGFGGQSFFHVIGHDGTSGSAKSAQNVYAPVMLPYAVNGNNASTGSTLSEDGTTAPVYPIPCAAPGVEPFVLNSMVVVHPGDAGATSVIQVATINGEARTYRAFPTISSGSTGPGVIAVGASANNTISNRCLPAIAWAV